MIGRSCGHGTKPSEAWIPWGNHQWRSMDSAYDNLLLDSESFQGVANLLSHFETSTKPFGWHHFSKSSARVFKQDLHPALLRVSGGVHAYELWQVHWIFRVFKRRYVTVCLVKEAIFLEKDPVLFKWLPRDYKILNLFQSNQKWPDSNYLNQLDTFHQGFCRNFDMSYL